jgi:ATP-dependent Zn protease
LIENYQTFTTKKPSDTSITELGISLTGDTVVNTVYNEKGLFGMLLEQFGSILLFFVIFFLGARLLMGRGGNGVSGLMNIQIGKKSTEENKKTKFSDIA